MKQLLLSLVVALVTACSTGSFDTDSLVRIELVGDGTATGFFVKPNRIVTAAHIVKSGYPERIIVHHSQGRVDAEIYHIDFDDDHMWLTVPIEGKPAKRCDGHIGQKMTVWSMAHSGKRIESTGWVYWEGQRKYWYTAKTGSGYSGSPIATGDCVIGIHQGRSIVNASMGVKLRSYE